MDDNNRSETESKKGSKKSRKDKKDRRRHSGKYQFHKLQNVYLLTFLSKNSKNIAKAKFVQVSIF